MKKISMSVFGVLFALSSPAFAMNYIINPPPGVCIFDIDNTLTEPGSMVAAKTCVDLGFAIGINTGQGDKGTAQTSMDAIYNNRSQRSFDHMHVPGETHFYDLVKEFYNTYHQVPNLIDIIGDGTDTPNPQDDNKPAYPGNIDKDFLFQYNGGCKPDATFQCTNYPYKHEGLESIAEFYYPDYQRSQPGDNPPARSEKINECIILFDDQKSTVERFANNLVAGSLGNTEQNAQQFRAIHILESGWKIDNADTAKATICKTIQNLPAHCQPSTTKIQEICS
jgi:hypothetical protein